ncbi:hypothetical protein [Neobacillus cucumis]|uniref:hypothetical protein n=1 Tax=Neobacillus cucumis TaxID=1740721 RepID=UPI00196445E4|nr:hypothetical protein [Neobacillus cucumis]MBM7656242.1 hypothetical protein [Neobacillus cucumis]
MEEVKLFASIHRSEGISLVDLAAILGTVFMLLGVIYGYKLTIGRILLLELSVFLSITR